MQKKFALVIVISLCLLLTACGGNTNAPSDTTSSNMADSTEIPDAAENDTDIQTEDKPTSEVSVNSSGAYTGSVLRDIIKFRY